MKTFYPKYKKNKSIANQDKYCSAQTVYKIDNDSSLKNDL